MWIFVLNGLAYLSYGIVTGRFRRKLFPISLREVFATVGDALRFRLGHDDLTHYNAVQKILYLGVMLVGILIVITGLCLWKPVQFSELADLFGSFQTIRLIHFLCMSAIVAFIVVHVTLALLVPQSLVAMLTGGPVVADRPLPSRRSARPNRSNAVSGDPMPIRTRTPSHVSAAPARSTRACSRKTARWSSDINRRNVLRGAISLGALTMLTGCDVSEERSGAESAARGVVVERRRPGGDLPAATIWRRRSARRRWSSRRVSTPITTSRTSSRSTARPGNWNWPGCIADKRPWTAQQIYQLPEQELIIRHICVEGWDYIGQWSGPNLRDFLRARRRRPDGEIRLFHLQRRLYRKHRHGDARCIRRPSSPPNTRATSSPIRSAIRCGCAPRPSSATRTPNGSRRSRSRTTFRETFWSKQGFNWFAGI